MQRRTVRLAVYDLLRSQQDAASVGRRAAAIAAGDRDRPYERGDIQFPDVGRPRRALRVRPEHLVYCSCGRRDFVRLESIPCAPVLSAGCWPLAFLEKKGQRDVHALRESRALMNRTPKGGSDSIRRGCWLRRSERKNKLNPTTVRAWLLVDGTHAP